MKQSNETPAKTTLWGDMITPVTEDTSVQNSYFRLTLFTDLLARVKKLKRNRSYVMTKRGLVRLPKRNTLKHTRKHKLVFNNIVELKIPKGLYPKEVLTRAFVNAGANGIKWSLFCSKKVK